MLNEAIKQWAKLADEAEEAVALGLIHPNVGNAKARVYRRTVTALEIQRDTGVAVCSCCHKPLGDEKPYWLRGSTSIPQRCTEVSDSSEV